MSSATSLSTNASQPTASPWIAFLLGLDAMLEGRRLRILLFLGLLQSVLAPLLDSTISGVRRLGGFSRTAVAIESASFAGFEGFSLLALLFVICVGVLVGAARLAALTARDDAEEPKAPLGRQLRGLWRIVLAEGRLLRRRDGMAQVLGVCLLVFSGMQTIRAVLSFCRWVLWETLVQWFSLEDTFVGAGLEAVYIFEGLLALIAAGTLCVVVLAFAGWAVRRPNEVRAVEGQVRELSLVRGGEPLCLIGKNSGDFSIAEAFHGTLVKQLLHDICEWSPPTHAEYEFEVRNDLAVYLTDHDYGVRVEYTLKTVGRRIDLVINECVAIELKIELKRSGEKDRARTQVVDYARAWTKGGPVIALIVATERPHIDLFAADARRWNLDFVPEKAAPLLVVSHNRGVS